jgi:hypothetical protein
MVDLRFGTSKRATRLKAELQLAFERLFRDIP